MQATSQATLQPLKGFTIRENIRGRHFGLIEKGPFKTCTLYSCQNFHDAMTMTTVCLCTCGPNLANSLFSFSRSTHWKYITIIAMPRYHDNHLFGRPWSLLGQSHNIAPWSHLTKLSPRETPRSVTRTTTRHNSRGLHLDNFVISCINFQCTASSSRGSQ